MYCKLMHAEKLLFTKVGRKFSLNLVITAIQVSPGWASAALTCMYSRVTAESGWQCCWPLTCLTWHTHLFDLDQDASVNNLEEGGLGLKPEICLFYQGVLPESTFSQKRKWNCRRLASSPCVPKATAQFWSIHLNATGVNHWNCDLKSLHGPFQLFIP